MQNIFRGSTKHGMNRRIAAALAEMEQEYLTQNKNSIENRWTLASQDEKARLWPQRFLHESFVTPSAQKEVLVVEAYPRSHELERLCGQMNILFESPCLTYQRVGLHTYVLGLDAQAISSRCAEIEREARHTWLREKREKEERQRKADEDFFRRLDLAKANTKDTKGEWDVSGKWIINCPYMEEQWGTEGQRCWIEFTYTKPDHLGLGQLYGDFDFIPFAGILRIVNLNNQPGGRPAGTCSTRQSRNDYTNPAQFFFPNTLLPSTKCQNFGFRWRGRETGEGETQFDSDEDLCSITFENPNALSGKFFSGLTGEIDFQGFREAFDSEPTDAPQKAPDFS